ncbi:MAG: sigma 54-interacting transcriptional regulator [Candidatus Synoicihabitans palmerolidicus]|nr:sigma 54-interacting transcriptional regulator [Candidatus Synoicihabitans palmerolidicus]
MLLQQLESLPFEMQKELVSVLRNTAHRFRLVCTTVEDLENMTDEGRFHDELFYRVASLPVTMPALRSHISDLSGIIKSILEKSTNPYCDAKLIEFSADAMRVLENYRWPGNGLEFSQVVTRIAASTESRIVGDEQLPMRLKELGQWPTLEP